MRQKNKFLQKYQAPIILIFILLLLFVDQWSKVWVKTNMALYESYDIASWFKIYFLENEGMAYGITIFNKLFLTLFRIVAMGLASYILYKVVKLKKYSLGYLLALALIISGGIGNIIDCVFYGKIFTDSTNQVASLTSWGEGYGELFYGKVVDMLHFPLIDTFYPEWVPYFGGERFLFFSPVFNLADSFISVGVGLLLLFYPRTFSRMLDDLGSKKANPEDQQEKDNE